jgi:hypothetical protein
MLTKEEIIQICRDSLEVENLTNSGTDTDKYSFKLYFETVADKISSRLDALVITQTPGKTKIPQTEEEKRELQIKVMQPFNGWMNYQIVEFLEWLIEWNKRKARESAAEHRRLSL